MAIYSNGAVDVGIDIDLLVAVTDEWTDATRPAIGPKFGYNTDTDQFEGVRVDGSIFIL